MKNQNIMLKALAVVAFIISFGGTAPVLTPESTTSHLLIRHDGFVNLTRCKGLDFGNPCDIHQLPLFSCHPIRQTTWNASTVSWPQSVHCDLYSGRECDGVQQLSLSMDSSGSDFGGADKSIQAIKCYPKLAADKKLEPDMGPISKGLSKDQDPIESTALISRGESIETTNGAQSRFINFYQDPNYAGNFIRYGEFGFGCISIDLDIFSTGNGISSIKVEGVSGLCEFWTETNCDGSSTFVSTGSVNDLRAVPPGHFNDNITSFQCLDSDEPQKAESDTRRIVTDESISVTDSMNLTFYEDTNFEGPSTRYEDFGSECVSTDDGVGITSIKLEGGEKCSFWTEWNCVGSAILTTWVSISDLSFVQDGKFNNKVESFQCSTPKSRTDANKITRRDNDAASANAITALTDVSTSGFVSVGVYGDAWYQGTYQAYFVAPQVCASRPNDPVFKEGASSIMMLGGTACYFYDVPNCQSAGSRAVLFTNQPLDDLGTWDGGQFNDRIKSFFCGFT